MNERTNKQTYLEGGELTVKGEVQGSIAQRLRVTLAQVSVPLQGEKKRTVRRAGLGRKTLNSDFTMLNFILFGYYYLK